MNDTIAENLTFFVCFTKRVLELSKKVSNDPFGFQNKRKSKTPRMSPGHLEEGTSDLLRDESLNLYIKDVGDDYLNSFHPSSDQKGGEQIPTSK